VFPQTDNNAFMAFKALPQTGNNAVITFKALPTDKQAMLQSVPTDNNFIVVQKRSHRQAMQL
jgi:hypothetical protein